MNSPGFSSIFQNFAVPRAPLGMLRDPPGILRFSMNLKRILRDFHDFSQGFPGASLGFSRIFQTLQFLGLL